VIVSPPGDDPIGYACPDFSQNAAVYRPRTPTGTPALIGLPNGNTWVTAQPNFVPDRRPLVVINFSNGSWSGKSNTNPNGDLSANYVPLIDATKAGNQFGLAGWWFGKHPQYPSVLTDTSSDSKSIAFTAATHILIPWAQYPSGVPLLQSGSNSASDQCDYLIATLDRYWADGFRRFVLFLPGGVPFGVQYGGYFEQRDANGNLVGSTVQAYWSGHNQPMNQWQLMPQWKQVEVQSRLSYWLSQHYPVPLPGEQIDPADIPSIELYTGSPVGTDVNDPCVQSNLWSPNVVLANQGAPPSQVNAPRWVSLATEWKYESGLGQFGAIGSIVPITPCAGSATFDLDPREVSHLRYVWDALNPWRSVGINRFWLDAGADNANVGSRRHLYGMLELAHNPVFVQNGFRFGAEAFPVIGNDGNVLDDCNALRAPWLGLLDACATRTGIDSIGEWTGYTFRNWNWSRSTSEAVLWVNHRSSYRNLVEARQRGFVLACANNEDPNGRRIQELIKRLYGCGWIYLADFNGDGDVDLTDLDDWRWMAQVYRPAHPNIGITSFGFGDINADGYVDSYDEATLLTAINQDIFGTYAVQSLWVNLGIGKQADR
jgi:hypothetical protein